jgi:hypothetical protein
MNKNRSSEHPLRKHIRAELEAGTPKKGLPVGIIVLVAILMLLLLPGIAILVRLWLSGGFTSLGEFVVWLRDCMGADCP